ncbi:hypothetical protein C0991_007826 [Blastosporella zonata]|nr:hypothetical protein C0991_007826 [Blastosporella zonata]
MTLKANNPNNILTGKRKRSLTERAHNTVKSIKEAVKRLSPPLKVPPNPTPSESERHRDSVASESSVSPIREPAHKKARLPQISSVDDSNDEAGPNHNGPEQNSMLPAQTGASSSSSSDVEEVTREEADRMELEKMQKAWRTSVYAFFKPDPEIVYNKFGRKSHVFTCTAKHCHAKVARYLNTKDAQSTSNMRKHVRKCWGEDVLDAADNARNKDIARKDIVEKYKKSGSIH